MATTDDSLLKRLLAIFQVEAAEHMKTMAALLQDLEKPAAAAETAALIETLFREVHSLKGAARAVNLADVEALCQAQESLLAAVKRDAAEMTPTLLSTLARGVDELSRLLATPSPGPPARAAAGAPPVAPVLSPLAAPAGDTVRIATRKLALLLVKAEELLTIKFGAGLLAGELHGLATDLAQWRKTRSTTVQAARALRRSRERHGKSVSTEQAAVIAKLLDAVDDDELTLKALGDRLAGLEHLAEQERRVLAGSVDSLQADMRAALMLPFASLLELLPKLVRDLARDSGKEATLEIGGAEIEIDRRILEQIKDPLIHLVRNAIDHGIESADERRRTGKPAAGGITITIAPRDGNRVELLVADDGAGANPEKIKAAASKLGLLTPAEAAGLDRAATLRLMFESGLTTSPILTELSGRGIGLAIVREKVEKLGGSIVAELPPGGGTLFRLLLPTTLSTFHGLLVALGERQFVLPTRSVERVLRVAADSVKTVENRATVEVAGQAVALIWLAVALGLPGTVAPETWLQLAVLEGGGRRIAFAVDAILGDQEVLVKGLGPQLRRVPNIAGATVLGPGLLVPILSVPDLFKSALRVPAPATVPVATPERRPALLVVEDSITARALLKNVLESAGFQVATAVDGIDALSSLRSGVFDLVVSDVEMPRMDGFELTARIRGDKKLADLPVVLVTALESQADKERGVEAGASAYIVKSSFDQSNLFEVIRRLL